MALKRNCYIINRTQRRKLFDNQNQKLPLLISKSLILFTANFKTGSILLHYFG